MFVGCVCIILLLESLLMVAHIHFPSVCSDVKSVNDLP